LEIPALLVACGSAFVAGAVNALAGGGTLLTFPALLWGGLLSPAANATSTAALFPAQLAALAGLREHLVGQRPLVLPLLALGTAGGLLGAWLLIATPSPVFDRLVPGLILVATILFLIQEPLAKRRGIAGEEESRTAQWSIGKTGVLVLVAVYGGYFGAGIGILTLAALGALGLRDIHRMNAVKSVFTVGANGIATLVFLVQGLADLSVSIPMTLTAAVGGYCGARFGKRIGGRSVRRVVIAVGFALAAVQMAKLVQ